MAIVGDPWWIDINDGWTGQGSFLRGSPCAIGLILIELQGRLRKPHILRRLVHLLLFYGLSHSFVSVLFSVERFSSVAE